MSNFAMRTHPLRAPFDQESTYHSGTLQPDDDPKTDAARTAGHGRSGRNDMVYYPRSVTGSVPAQVFILFVPPFNVLYDKLASEVGLVLLQVSGFPRLR